MREGARERAAQREVGGEKRRLKGGQARLAAVFARSWAGKSANRKRKAEMAAGGKWRVSVCEAKAYTIGRKRQTGSGGSKSRRLSASQAAKQKFLQI